MSKWCHPNISHHKVPWVVGQKTHVLLTDAQDPLQFAYRRNRTMDNIITLARNPVLTHIEKGNTTFNTIISLMIWSPNSMTLGLEWFRLPHKQDPSSNRTSYSLITNAGTLQGCVLSPLLYSLFTDNSAAKLQHFQATIMGLITHNDKTEEVKALNNWCQENKLYLNISTTKEMLVE